VSGYPIVLEGEAITALVVGGGRVAERKVRALLASGAQVRVVALAVADSLRALAVPGSRCTIAERGYERSDLEGATLVFAATDGRELNSTIAEDARGAGILVHLADDGARGDFVNPALYRNGPLLVAVSAGGVPGAAARIRDAVAERFGEPFAIALARLEELRSDLLGAGDREGWSRAAASLLDDDFCERVESGAMREELSAWRCS
jgi:precorrin-2 dehydrogenase/sirohydrochlorin ferrochelatase